jgi:V8-like Glu-specific endopeptidase
MPEDVLQVEERQRLTQYLSEVYEFSSGDPRDRHSLLRTAGLTRFLGGIALNGAPRTVAGDLMERLERFGELPDRPAYHALGSLLSYLLTLGELPREHAAFFAALIVRYSLVNDPAYIRRLRAEHGIAEGAVRPPAGTSPPRADAQTPLDQEGPVADAIRKLGLETVIPAEDNFLDVYLLGGAMYSAQAVCLIEVPPSAKATGFLVGPDLMLTARHVFGDADEVGRAVARFGYVADATGVAQPGRAFKIRPGFVCDSPPDVLDYALLRLEGRPLGDALLEEDLSLMEMVRRGVHRGYLELAPRLIAEGDRVNIIQHPLGGPLKVVMTQNYVVEDMAESSVRYVANTMRGSAGAPVLNERWEVVALHHAGRPYSLAAWEGAERLKGSIIKINEGIPVRAIVEDLRAKGIDGILP